MAKQPTIIKAPDGTDLIRTEFDFNVCGGCYLYYYKTDINKCPHNFPKSEYKGEYWCTKTVFGVIKFFIFKPAF